MQNRKEMSKQHFSKKVKKKREKTVCKKKSTPGHETDVHDMCVLTTAHEDTVVEEPMRMECQLQ
jgi:hypothetical protein